MVDERPSIRLVRDYIEASQRARASGKAEDFQVMRSFMANDFETKVASAWTGEPWQVMQRGRCRHRQTIGADQQGHVAYH